MFFAKIASCIFSNNFTRNFALFRFHIFSYCQYLFIFSSMNGILTYTIIKKEERLSVKRKWCKSISATYREKQNLRYQEKIEFFKCKHFQ